jgi:hypothetical protein
VCASGANLPIHASTLVFIFCRNYNFDKMMKFTLLSCVLIALVSRSGAQTPGAPYPTNRTACDYNTCTGCAPFEPPPGAPQDLLCGVDDVYFPVPTLILQNDTSPTKELYPVRWLCVACCTVNCGFNNLGSHCRWRNYKYNASATNTYGCVHCSTKGALKQFGGTVTTQFAMQSTKAVYKTINLGYGRKFFAFDVDDICICFLKSTSWLSPFMRVLFS